MFRSHGFDSAPDQLLSRRLDDLTSRYKKLKRSLQTERCHESDAVMQGWSEDEVRVHAYSL